MRDWHRHGSGTLVSQKVFPENRDKVGHVLLFTVNPKRWNAFFDGIYIGKASTEEEAKTMVETRARIHVSNVSFR